MLCRSALAAAQEAQTRMLLPAAQPGALPGVMPLAEPLLAEHRTVSAFVQVFCFHET